MNGLLAISVAHNYLLYAIPLVVTVSLVYAATRHEAMPFILRHAARIGLWIAGFMSIIFAVLALVAWWV